MAKKKITKKEKNPFKNMGTGRNNKRKKNKKSLWRRFKDWFINLFCSYRG